VLSQLFALKHQLVMRRKLVTPQRDMVSAMMAQVVTPVRLVPAAWLAGQSELSRRPGGACEQAHG
jgi:hypothetical protein